MSEEEPISRAANSLTNSESRPNLSTLPKLNNNRHALPSFGALPGKSASLNGPNSKTGSLQPLPSFTRPINQKFRRGASLLMEGEDAYASRGAVQEATMVASSGACLTTRTSMPEFLTKLDQGSGHPQPHINPVFEPGALSPRPVIKAEELVARPSKDEWKEAKERARAEAARRRATSESPSNPLKREITKQDREKAIATIAKSYLKKWLRSHGALVRPPKMHNNVRRVISAWFDLVDADGGGSLDSSELLTALKAAGIPCDDRTILEMIKLMDFNSDGEISWPEFENFMSNEFASGKTLLSGEYVLPSGTSLPFGAMITKMKRNRMIEDIMEGGERRQKWVSLTHNARAMQEELNLFANIEASQDEEHGMREKEGRALNALAEICEREQSAASAAVANAKRNVAAHRMEAAEADMIIEAAEKRAEVARTEADAARRAVSESAKERRTQQEAQSALKKEMLRVRGPPPPPASSAFRKTLRRMGSSDMAAAEAELALKNPAGGGSSTAVTNVSRGGSSGSSSSSSSSSDVHSGEDSDIRGVDGKREGSEPPLPLPEQIEGGDAEEGMAGRSVGDVGDLLLPVPMALGGLQGRKLSVVVEAEKEGKVDSPSDSPGAGHSPRASHKASRQSSLGRTVKPVTPAKSLAVQEGLQPERLNTAARAARREASKAALSAASTPADHKRRHRHPGTPKHHNLATQPHLSHPPTPPPLNSTLPPSLPPPSPRLNPLPLTQLEPLQQQAQQQQARPCDLTPPPLSFERGSPSCSGDGLVAASRGAACDQVWSVPNSPSALELARAKAGSGSLNAYQIAKAKGLPGKVPPSNTHPTSTPPSSHRRSFVRSITAEHLGSPSTASLAAATASAAITAGTQAGPQAAGGGGVPALRVSDGSIPSEGNSVSSFQPLMPPQRVWKSQGGSNKEQSELRLSNLGCRGSSNGRSSPSLPHLTQGPQAPNISRQPHGSSPLQSSLQSSFRRLAAVMRPAPPARAFSRSLFASLYDPKPPPNQPS